MQMLPLPVAAIAIPSAWQCFKWLAPVAALVLLRVVLLGMDRFLARFFPSLEWQRNLGWLNIKAERRAARVLRGIGYAVMAIMALALFGVAWGAAGLRLLPHWTDPDTLAEIDLRLPVLCASLGLLLLYFVSGLIPRLRREYEEEELKAFRAEWAALEEEKQERETSRLGPGRGRDLSPRSWPPR